MHAPLRPSVSLLFLCLVAACDDQAEDSAPQDLDTGTPPVEDSASAWTNPADLDGDGYSEFDGDCDDGDDQVHPNREEDCNGKDDNCNGNVDEGFADGDFDGTADCMDVEECDGMDNDGDGVTDEQFADGDDDGVADCVDVEECDGLDNDGDGQTDEGFDSDGDGFVTCGEQLDCDDDDAAINPGAEEAEGNLTDDDCDGLVDEGFWTEGDLIINEVMNNPLKVADDDGEWFELLNQSGRTLYLNGLLIRSGEGDEHLVTSQQLLTLEPGGLYVMALNGDDDDNGGIQVDYVYSDVVLSNETDELTIEAGDVLLDQVSWDDGATMPDPSGASLSLDPVWQEEDGDRHDPAYWCAASESWAWLSDLGSPGASNPSCLEDPIVE